MHLIWNNLYNSYIIYKKVLRILLITKNQIENKHYRFTDPSFSRFGEINYFFRTDSPFTVSCTRHESRVKPIFPPIFKSRFLAQIYGNAYRKIKNGADP